MNFDGYADVVYIGDLGGNLWKWVITAPGDDPINNTTQDNDPDQPDWPFRRIFRAGTSLEQALRSGACGAVLAWTQNVRPVQVRRLQLAAETGDGLGWLFRPAADAAQASPAALRLSVMREAGVLRVAVRKRPSGWGGGEVRIRP